MAKIPIGKVYELAKEAVEKMKASRAEAEEGSARDFLKAQGRRLRWTDEVIQGRLSWFGWDDSLRQPNRHGVAAAKIVKRRTGEWMIVWIEKMDRDFVHTFQNLEDAQRYAEKKWFDEGRANWEKEEYNRNHVW